MIRKIIGQKWISTILVILLLSVSAVFSSSVNGSAPVIDQSGLQTVPEEQNGTNRDNYLIFPKDNYTLEDAKILALSVFQDLNFSDDVRSMDKSAVHENLIKLENSTGGIVYLQIKSGLTLKEKDEEQGYAELEAKDGTVIEINMLKSILKIKYGKKTEEIGGVLGEKVELSYSENRLHSDIRSMDKSTTWFKNEPGTRIRMEYNEDGFFDHLAVKNMSENDKRKLDMNGTEQEDFRGIADNFGDAQDLELRGPTEYKKKGRIIRDFYLSHFEETPFTFRYQEGTLKRITIKPWHDLKALDMLSEEEIKIAAERGVKKALKDRYNISLSDEKYEGIDRKSVYHHDLNREPRLKINSKISEHIISGGELKKVEQGHIRVNIYIDIQNGTLYNYEITSSMPSSSDSFLRGFDMILLPVSIVAAAFILRDRYPY